MAAAPCSAVVPADQERAGAVRQRLQDVLPRTSVFARLVYIASLRDLKTGSYHHSELVEALGSEAAHHALKAQHQHAFIQWSRYSFDQARAEVERYLGARQQMDATSAPLCACTSIQSHIPDSMALKQRLLYTCNLKGILTALRRGPGITILADRFFESFDLDWRVLEAVRRIGNLSSEERLTLEQLAKDLGACERHLGRLFRHQTGLFFRDYLRSSRLQRAAAFLVCSEVTVQVAADQVGYGDPANFSRDFKSHFGVSSKEYRDALSPIASAAVPFA